jgi:uncharacterized protein (TIGR02145 family)
MKACPGGWHLPSDAEWNALITAVGGILTASKHLKAKSNDGLDTYGFAAMPIGESCSGDFCRISGGFWWSATESSADNAHFNAIGYGDDADRGNDAKSLLFGVRCVKD